MTTIPEPHPAASGPGTPAAAEEPQIPASARRAPDLAQRTQESTQEIGELIATLQQGTTEASARSTGMR